jgi:sarcosine oxidase subunit beta
LNQQYLNLHHVYKTEDVHDLQARVERERAAGLDVTLVGPSEVDGLAPAVGPAILAAAFSRQDGQANPPMTTRAFAAAAQRHGATYATGSRVEQLVVENGQVTGIIVTGQQILADWVVVAAGAWSTRLVSPVGLDLPVVPRAPQMLLTTAARPALRPTLSATGRSLSLKQLPGGEFFIGGGWPSDVIEASDNLTCRVRDESVRGSWGVATTMVPAVGEQRILRSWCGVEAQCIDGVPLIGEVPGLRGLYLALGFSGHGFQLSPAVGRVVAHALSGGTTPELDGLEAARMTSLDATSIAEFRARSAGGMAGSTLR